MATNDTNKRKRTATDTLNITNLPVGILVNVSAYLSKPSSAIFAAAITAPSSSWKNDNLMHRLSDRSSAIISPLQWDILDFADIESALAKKLTDNDIHAVLQCINAQDVLKRLKITGCVNIVGHGLKPISGSTTIQVADLGLAKQHKHADDALAALISHEAVIPILDSIISVGGCSLKYTVFPEKWHMNGRNEMIDGFVRRYNERFDSYGLDCPICPPEEETGDWRLQQGQGEWMEYHTPYLNWNNVPGIYLQGNICYQCLGTICRWCVTPNADQHPYLKICEVCDRSYCFDCQELDYCCVATHVDGVPVSPHAVCQCHQVCNGCSVRCFDCDWKFCKEKCSGKYLNSNGVCRDGCYSSSESEEEEVDDT